MKPAQLLLREAGATLLFLMAATLLISATGGDLSLSSYFQVEKQWPVGNHSFWQFFYNLNRWPAVAMGITGLYLALCGTLRPAWARWKRRGVFLALLTLLGPGVLVNFVFKEHWGRPRPREVVELGGTKGFLQPWQWGASGGGRSFPSGHASAAFVMTAPYFIYRRTHRRRALTWLTAGTVFGMFMSIARITQGGHFLSDCLWAWGMVHLTALVLAALILPRQDTVLANAAGS